MNAAHFHLVINHFPIVLPIVGVVVLVTGFISRSGPVQRTGYLIFVLGSISTLVAMNSGEGAEELVENLPGVTGNYIEKHEETAETFSIFSYLLGGISVLGVWATYRKKSFARILPWVTLLFAGVTLFFAQRTGTTGGEIIHTEIRQGTIPNPAAKPDQGEAEDHH